MNIFKAPKKWLLGGLAALGMGGAGGFTLLHIQSESTGQHSRSCVFSSCPTTILDKNSDAAKSSNATTVKRQDIPTFTAVPETNGDWAVIAEVDGKKRPLIRTVDPNWGREYTREARAKMIVGKLNQYFQSTPLPVALTTGVKHGFSILCVSESVNKGCLKDKDLGQIMTFGRNADPVADKETIIAMIDDKGNHTRRADVVRTAPRLYIDMKKFFKGEDPIVVGE